MTDAPIFDYHLIQVRLYSWWSLPVVRSQLGNPQRTSTTAVFGVSFCPKAVQGGERDPRPRLSLLAPQDGRKPRPNSSIPSLWRGWFHSMLGRGPSLLDICIAHLGPTDPTDRQAVSACPPRRLVGIRG